MSLVFATTFFFLFFFGGGGGVLRHSSVQTDFEFEISGSLAVMLGIIHTCTTLGYKLAFIAHGRVSDCHARDPGSILNLDHKQVYFSIFALAELCKLERKVIY